jgi:hypothetical protein
VGEDIRLLGSYGADAVLVGSRIMASSDISIKVKIGKLNGITIIKAAGISAGIDKSKITE